MFRRVGGRDNIVVPAMILVEVDLDFRPNFLEDSILKGVIPQQIVSDSRPFSGGQAVPQCSLDVEILIALSVSNRGRNDRLNAPSWYSPVGKLIW